MQFTVDQLSEIECYLSEQGAVFLVESLENISGLNDSERVCNAIAEFEHEEAAFAMLQKAQRAGTKFTLSQIARIADYVTEDGALLMLHNLKNGLALATQNDVCEIVKNVVYEAFCNELTQMALETGIRFDPNNIIAMNGCVDIAVLNMMVDTCPIQFKRNQLLELRHSISDDVFCRAAQKSNIFFGDDE